MDKEKETVFFLMADDPQGAQVWLDPRSLLLLLLSRFSRFRLCVTS